MIVIRPKGGLCNRLRAIDSAIALAAETHHKVYLLWVMNWECNCRFSDLFELPTEIYRLTELNEGDETKAIDSRASYVFSHYGNFYIDQDILNRSSRRISWSKISSRYRHIYIHSYDRFFQPTGRLTTSRFIPLPSIRKVITGYGTKNMLGVHVRRSDNREAIAYSPLSSFITRMKLEVEDDESVRFFLATDAPSVEKELSALFPGRIISHTKSSLNRADSVAIHAAVVDLFCLAGCKKILGSFWSSFSITAAEIYGSELEIIKESQFSLKPFASGEFPLRIKLSAEIQVSENSGEGLLVQTSRGKVLQLNEMSAAILSLCEQSMSFSEILQRFKTKYPEEDDVVENGVIEIMEFLLAHQVISAV